MKSQPIKICELQQKQCLGGKCKVLSASIEKEEDLKSII